MTAAFFLILTAVAGRAPTPADLAIFSARIWTGEASRPQAQALAAHDGRIIAVGSNRDIQALAGPATRVIQGRGRRILPGSIDARTHMSMGGFNLLAVDLRHTKDEGEFTAQLARFAKTRPAGQWILGPSSLDLD